MFLEFVDQGKGERYYGCYIDFKIIALKKSLCTFSSVFGFVHFRRRSFKLLSIDFKCSHGSTKRKRVEMFVLRTWRHLAVCMMRWRRQLAAMLNRLPSTCINVPFHTITHSNLLQLIYCVIIGHWLGAGEDLEELKMILTNTYWVLLSNFPVLLWHVFMLLYISYFIFFIESILNTF